MDILCHLIVVGHWGWPIFDFFSVWVHNMNLSPRTFGEELSESQPLNPLQSSAKLGTVYKL